MVAAAAEAPGAMATGAVTEAGAIATAATEVGVGPAVLGGRKPLAARETTPSLGSVRA